MNQTASRKTLRKYIVLQIPGALMVALLLLGLHYAGTVTGVMASLLMLGWVTKDAVMYRFVRAAYGPGPPHGTEALIGQRAVVVEALTPEGRVRVGAEHWSARPGEGAAEIAEGAHVTIVAVDGYTVRVVEDR
ncbi:MAG: hypothetical protein GY733_02020 [bacterium]|nr:hypothetical protein [bacterium]